MIDVEIARAAAFQGKDLDEVRVTRRWLKRALFEIENGRKSTSDLMALRGEEPGPPHLDYDPFTRQSAAGSLA